MRSHDNVVMYKLYDRPNVYTQRHRYTQRAIYTHSVFTPCVAYLTPITPSVMVKRRVVMRVWHESGRMEENQV